MFKQRKNKTFNYQPRFSKEEVLEDTPSNEKEFVSKWKIKAGNNRKGKGVISFKALILILVLLLICMYLLDSRFK